MKEQLPWVGFALHLQYHRMALEQAGIEVIALPTASEGLDEVVRNQHKLILVRGSIDEPGENLYSNYGINSQDPVQIACDVIRKIRASSANGSTPIIATTMNSSDLYGGTGVTQVVNTMNIMPSQFVPIVRQYLK